MSYNTLFYIYYIFIFVYLYSLKSYNRPFECNHNANVARDEIEFDTPDLHTSYISVCIYVLVCMRVRIYVYT